jgi:hypothetical protein
MPTFTIHLGGGERLGPAISKATPLGALGTEALVWLGTTSIRGRAAALRALADALIEAADLADAYDADPEAFNEREQAERDRDRDEPRRSCGPRGPAAAGQPPNGEHPATSADRGP